MALLDEKGRIKKMSLIIKEHALELLGKEAYDSYYNLILNICKNEQGYHYVILLDRKGSEVFRAFLRILKFDNVLNTDTLPIIISSRTDGCYKIPPDSKILLFDDIVNKARNLERIVSNLHRRGLRDFSYCALAYRKTLLENTDEAITNSAKVLLNDAGDPIIKFTYNDDEKPDYEKGYFTKIFNHDGKNFFVKIFFVRNQNIDGDFLLESRDGEVVANGNYFLEPDKTKRLSYLFNRIIHFSVTPYTAYSAYVRFTCCDADKKFVLPKQIPNYFAYDLDVHVCNIDRVDAKLYCKEANEKNGYFAGIRVFSSRTGEILIHPSIVLPSLTGEKIKELYKKLDFDKLSIDGDTPLDYSKLETAGYKDNGMDKIDEDDYKNHLDTKNKYECATRRIISLLSAIYIIDFIKDSTEIRKGINYKSVISEDDIINKIAKSLTRYFLAHLLTNAKNKKKCKSVMMKFLSDAYKTVNAESKGIFNFLDETQYPPNPYVHNENTELLEKYTPFIKESKSLSDDFREKLLKTVNGKTSLKYEFINIADDDKVKSEDIKISVKNALNSINTFLAQADSQMVDRKFFPLPLLEIIQAIYSIISAENNTIENLYMLVMVGIDSYVEDGLMSTCVYAEQDCVDKVNYLTSTYLQRGELSLLGFVRFLKQYVHYTFNCGSLYALNNAHSMYQLYAKSLANNKEQLSVLNQEFPHNYIKRFISDETRGKEIRDLLEQNMQIIEKKIELFDLLLEVQDEKLSELNKLWVRYLLERFATNKTQSSFIDYQIPALNPA